MSDNPVDTEAGLASQQPAEGDQEIVDRELARKDGGNAHAKEEHDNDADIHAKVRKAMDDVAPQTGVRAGP